MKNRRGRGGVELSNGHTQQTSELAVEIGEQGFGITCRALDEADPAGGEHLAREGAQLELHDHRFDPGARGFDRIAHGGNVDDEPSDRIGWPPGGTMSISDYESYDAVGLAELVRNGDTKPEELLETAVALSEERNPS